MEPLTDNYRHIVLHMKHENTPLNCCTNQRMTLSYRYISKHRLGLPCLGCCDGWVRSSISGIILKYPLRDISDSRNFLCFQRTQDGGSAHIDFVTPFVFYQTRNVSNLRQIHTIKRYNYNFGTLTVLPRDSYYKPLSAHETFDWSSVHFLIKSQHLIIM